MIFKNYLFFIKDNNVMRKQQFNFSHKKAKKY